MNDSVVVRPAARPDADRIAAIYAPYVTDGATSFEEVPPSATVIEQRMCSEPRLPWLVAAADGDVVGYCYATRHRERAAYRWSADVSVYVDRDRHRRGAGRALYSRLLPELRALGYVSAFAGIVLPNPASVRLHEAMGFTAVGIFRDVGFKHGAWRDVGWWGMKLVPRPAVPDEPAGWEPLG